MPLRPIVAYPDPRLNLPAAEVTAFDADLAALADDLLATMRAAPGVGITAPHVGISLRLVVLELSPETGVQVFVNPKVVWAAPERARHVEGSVSLPGALDELERPARVRVAYQDLTGAPHEIEADGFLGVCLQHEIDQLDGIFFIDRLSRLKRERLLRKHRKRARG